LTGTDTFAVAKASILVWAIQAALISAATSSASAWRYVSGPPSSPSGKNDHTSGRSSVGGGNNAIQARNRSQ